MDSRPVAHISEDGRTQPLYDHLFGTAQRAEHMADAFGCAQRAQTEAEH